MAQLHAEYAAASTEPTIFWISPDDQEVIQTGGYPAAEALAILLREAQTDARRAEIMRGSFLMAAT